VLAEQLVAIPALKGLVREVTAHHAVDFFHHLSLQLVLNFVHLDVKLWNWLRAHNPVYGFVTNNHIECLRTSLVLVENLLINHLLLLHRLLAGTAWRPCWGFAPLYVLLGLHF
jgi:hypothetical protein